MISETPTTISDVPNDKGYPLRMPTAIYDALKRAADAEDRSMNNLVVRILKDWLTAHGFLK